MSPPGAARFGLFDHVEDIPGTPTSRLFRDRLELIRTADEAGFYGYHLAEHHGGDLCMVPSQEILIAAASQVTRNIRLGPMVKQLPMHHPIRVIEDICALDQLTEGRLEVGVGRGAVPIEHYWFGHDWLQSRDRFTDSLGIIQRGLQGDEISSAGSRFFDFPPVPLVTKPLQDRIPFWYPGSPVTAGTHGMSLMWPGRIDAAAYELYIATWHQHRGTGIRLDGPDDRPRVGYSMLLAIARTEREALAIARRGIDGLTRRTAANHRFDHLKLGPEECHAAQAPLRAIRANVDQAVQFGAGTPAQIAERLAMLLDDGMCDYLAFMTPTGDITIDEARQTLELFVTEVQPQLAAAD
ncbi:MAG: LLM class flavin-dependent oxidoreductase [Solirubrobacteraceae bacterium]